MSLIFRAIASATLVAVLSLMVESIHTEYYLGEQGQNCQEVCAKRGLVCSANIETGLDHPAPRANLPVERLATPEYIETKESVDLYTPEYIEPKESFDLFEKLGIQCIADNRTWWAHDQPCYVSDHTDGNYGRCLGYHGVPSTVSCTARHWAVQRLCRCLQDPVYIMGSQGEDCNAACSKHGLGCSTDYTTVYGSVSRFYDLEVSCTPDYRNYWWAHDQPCYVSGETDINYGKCLGFLNIPAAVRCDGKYPSVQRLCHCICT